jgi:hypothetical protein
VRRLLTRKYHQSYCAHHHLRETFTIRLSPRTSSATMSESSSREMSRSPSNSSQSTDITRPSLSEGTHVKASAPESAFKRWRPSYHLQAPSGWMNVSYQLRLNEHQETYSPIHRTHVRHSMTPKQISTMSHINQVWISPTQIGVTLHGVRPLRKIWSHGTSNTNPPSHQTLPTMSKEYSQAVRCPAVMIL